MCDDYADEDEHNDADNSGASAVESEGVSSTRSGKPFESNEKKSRDLQPSATHPPRLVKQTTVSSLKSADVLFFTAAIPAASLFSAATNVQESDSEHEQQQQYRLHQSLT